MASAAGAALAGLLTGTVGAPIALGTLPVAVGLAALIVRSRLPGRPFAPP